MDRRIYRKIGRNDLCPCGSGKKVKKCDCEGVLKRNDYLNLDSMEVRRGNEIVGIYRDKGEVG